MQIELRTDPDSHRGIIASLDHEGDLALTGGNLYIFIDGQEYGSLYFYGERGEPRIMLGQFAAEEDEWVDRNPLTGPVEPW